MSRATNAGRPVEQTQAFRGQHLSIADLAAHPEARVGAGLIRERLRRGWSVDAAVTTPKLNKSAAGRRSKLNPNTACVVIPRGETVRKSVR